MKAINVSSVKIKAFADAAIRTPYRDRGSDVCGCDCYGIVVWAFKEILGVALPEYPGIAEGASLAKLRQILAAADGPDWSEIPAGSEQALDVVLMRGQIEHEGRRHSRPIHIGLVIEPGTLMHIEAGAGVTIADYRRHTRLKSRLAGFYRYRGQSC